MHVKLTARNTENAIQFAPVWVNTDMVLVYVSTSTCFFSCPHAMKRPACRQWQHPYILSVTWRMDGSPCNNGQGTIASAAGLFYFMKIYSSATSEASTLSLLSMRFLVCSHVPELKGTLILCPDSDFTSHKVTCCQTLHSSCVFKHEGKVLALKGMFFFVLVRSVKDKPARSFTLVSFLYRGTRTQWDH